jgi:hypothetical protein
MSYGSTRLLSCCCLPAFAVALALSACSAAEPASSKSGSGGGSGTGGGSETGGNGTGGTTTGSGGAGTGGASGSGSLQLPLAVDDFYVASGYMGDGETPGNVTQLPDGPMADRTCGGNRAKVDAVGACHSVSYAQGALGWAGVYWQSPENNWGTSAGLPIPAGATQVSFSAKGAMGGEIITFLAGGIGGTTTPPPAYADAFKEELKATLTNQWASYSISLAGKTYGGSVVGGFGWVTATQDNTLPLPITFYVDDIQWK